MSTSLKKVGVYVDVQNIYYTCKHAFGRSFNYRAFWLQLTEQFQITHAYAYAIDKGDDQQRKFQDALRHIGFDVKLKPYIQRADGTSKGDWDVGITMDVMQTMNEVDCIVLLSGDGDFDRLLEYANQQGKSTLVYGVESLTARSLVKSASQFQPIGKELLL